MATRAVQPSRLKWAEYNPNHIASPLDGVEPSGAAWKLHPARNITRVGPEPPRRRGYRGPIAGGGEAGASGLVDQANLIDQWISTEKVYSDSAGTTLITQEIGSDGTAVGGWRGAINDTLISQATGANQPSYEWNEINSAHPAVLFNIANSDFLEGSSSLANAYPLTVYAVFQPTTTSHQGVIFWHGDTVGVNDFDEGIYDFLGIALNSFGGGASGAAVEPYPAIGSVSNPYLMTFRIGSTTDREVNYHNYLRGTLATNIDGITDADGFIVGKRDRSTFHLDGSIGELRVYSADHDLETQDEVRAEMAASFSMNLPFRPYDELNLANAHFMDYEKITSNGTTLMSCPTDDTAAVHGWGDWNWYNAKRGGWELQEATNKPILNCTEDALEFEGTDYLWTTGNGIHNDDTVTYYVRFRVGNLTDRMAIGQLSAAGGATTNALALEFRGDSGDIIQLREVNGGTEYTIDGAVLSVDTWYVATMIKRSATDRELYLDGVSQGTDTNSVVASSRNIEAIGGNWGAWDRFMTGMISETRFYDLAHDADTIAAVVAEMSLGNPTLNQPS